MVISSYGQAYSVLLQQDIAARSAPAGLIIRTSFVCEQRFLRWRGHVLDWVACSRLFGAKVGWTASGRALSHRAFQSHLGCKLNVRRRARVRRGGPKRAPRTRNHEKA